MQRSTFKVLFYVKRQSEKSGRVPVMGRITINGTMSQFRVKLLPAAEMLYKRYKDTYRTSEKVFPLKGTYKTLNMSLRHVARHAGLERNRSRFIVKRIFKEEFVVLRRDPSQTQFVARLNAPISPLGHNRLAEDT